MTINISNQKEFDALPQEFSEPTKIYIKGDIDLIDRGFLNGEIFILGKAKVERICKAAQIGSVFDSAQIGSVFDSVHIEEVREKASVQQITSGKINILSGQAVVLRQYFPSEINEIKDDAAVIFLNDRPNRIKLTQNINISSRRRINIKLFASNP